MQNVLKQFTLPLKGIGLGQQSFNYVIGKEFFEQFEDSEIENATIQAVINLNKQTRIIEIEFNFKGTVMVQCDRCLDDFDLPLDVNHKLYVKFGKDETEETDDMIVLSESEHEFNLAQSIYEFINLSLPIKKVHGTNKQGKSLCNAEMLSKLSNYIVDTKEKTDPRWNKLKDLM
jgi:uncharacterized metal-binding protein YceD (DUF177 family)